MLDFKQIDDKVVVFGMSCSGKTTFSLKATEHKYHCFDALFQWHLIETLGLSISENLKYVQQICQEEKFILDGWHLSDKEGLYLPKGAVVYVIWAPYEKVISQYRIPVNDPEEHRSMYNKWYCEINYDNLPSVKYFQNAGDFCEITRDQFNFFKT
jgi:hypothetical protein